jgi:MFS family permease
MQFYRIAALTVFNSITFKGSKLVLSLFAISLGATPLEVGVLIAIYSAPPILMALPVGRLTDRVGSRLPLLVGSVGLVAGVTVPWLAPGKPALFASATIIGVAFVFFQVAAHSLVGTIGGPQDRTRNYATYTLGVALAGFIGPLIVGFSIDHQGHALTYLVLAAFPLLPIALILSDRSLAPRLHAGPVREDRRRLRDLLRHRPLRRVLLMGSVMETGLELYAFYLPIYGHSIGLSASWIGAILATFAAATMLVRVWLPSLARRHGDERVLALSMAVAGITYFAFPVVQHPLLLAVASFALGMGMGCGNPLSMSLTYTRAPGGRTGEALGMRLTVNKITQAAVPLVFGTIGSAFGIAAVFWINGALLASGGVIARLREPAT